MGSRAGIVGHQWWNVFPEENHGVAGGFTTSITSNALSSVRGVHSDICPKKQKGFGGKSPTNWGCPPKESAARSENYPHPKMDFRKIVAYEEGAIP